MPKYPVKTELDTLKSLLTGDTPITKKQRFALMVSYAAIEWTQGLSSGRPTKERPSVAIMRSSESEIVENHSQ